MTTEFSDGFEAGDGSAWDGETLSGGVLAYHADYKKSGSYGMRYLGDNGSETGYLYQAVTNGTGEVNLRAYIKVNSAGFTGDGIIYHMRMIDVSTSQWFQLQTQLLGTGVYKMRVGVSDDDGVTSGTLAEVTKDQWLKVELHATGVGTADTDYEVLVDGGQIDALTGRDSSSSDFDRIDVGTTFCAAGLTACSFYWDDVDYSYGAIYIPKVIVIG